MLVQAHDAVITGRGCADPGTSDVTTGITSTITATCSSRVTRHRLQATAAAAADQ